MDKLYSDSPPPSKYYNLYNRLYNLIVSGATRCGLVVQHLEMLCCGLATNGLPSQLIRCPTRTYRRQTLWSARWAYREHFEKLVTFKLQELFKASGKHCCFVGLRNLRFSARESAFNEKLPFTGPENKKNFADQGTAPPPLPFISTPGELSNIC